jgi:uncharacterized protein YyaL (SSP411 family)
MLTECIKGWMSPAISMGLLSLSLFCGCKDAPQQFKNRLANASSPYLREHADNPVDWYEWGDEAMIKAKKENKPLIISVGYAACHWCHVMERESFMDTGVARLMNENIVAVKVDREERPDLDNLYINACQLLNNGEAGWPLNAFALPDGKPFFAGTYYTKDNWIKLLKQIAESYRNKNSKVVLQANALTFGIIDNDSLLLVGEKGKTGNGRDLYRSLFENAYRQIDLTNGGLKGQEKFPTPSLWEFMLQYYHLTGNRQALDATTNTISKMAMGGIYDHIGGGFARYSTDSLWRVPHFEKMLYDNAQLVSLYSHAYQITKSDYFRKIVAETIDFIDKELASPAGGVYCSINADTREEEGGYYTWKSDELNDVLDKKNVDVVKTYYNISFDGNWEKGRNILYSAQEPSSFASAKNIPDKEFEAILNSFRDKLLVERNKRVKPSVDDKILTSWNALLLTAYVDAFTAFGDRRFLKKALAIASFIEKNMLDGNGHLWRSFRNGRGSIDGFLDDYALLAKAYIGLYEVTFDKYWLILSTKLADYSITNFYDNKSGLFYYTSSGSAKLAARKIEILNNVIPSSNAVMGEVLFVLGTLLENEVYLQKSSSMMTKIAGRLGETIAYSPEWGYLAGMISHSNYEVAIMGAEALQKNSEMQKNYLPNSLFMGGVEENLPLLENKLPGKGTLIYVCVNKTCRLPVSDVSRALQQIK